MINIKIILIVNCKVKLPIPVSANLPCNITLLMNNKNWIEY